MGPSCRRSTRKSSSTRSRRALLEKNQENSPVPHSDHPAKRTASSTPKVAISSHLVETPDAPSSPCSLSTDCSTPKAKRFRIPEIKTCPPAPKKRRILTNLPRTSPIPFFAHPDIDLFFYLALRGIPV